MQSHGRKNAPRTADCVRELLPFIPTHNNTWARPKETLQKLSGVYDFTLHDLRRTHSTIQARLGTPPHIIDAILNHASGQIRGVAAIYNRHRYFDEMRDSLNRFENWFISLVALA
jgi:integrase